MPFLRINVHMVLWGLLGLMALLSVWGGMVNAWTPSDFQWLPARQLLRGVDPYPGSEGFACYAPSCYFFLFPWTLIPDGVVAAHVWAFCNLGFTVFFLAGVWRLIRQSELNLSFGSFVLVSLFLICGVPWRGAVGCGQHVLFSLAFFVWALWGAREGRWWTGLLLAVGLYKYAVTVPLLLAFVALRAWKPVLVAVGVHAALTLLASCLTGIGPFQLLAESFNGGVVLSGQGVSDLGSLVAFFKGLPEGLPQAKLAGFVGLVLFGFCWLLVLLKLLVRREGRDEDRLMWLSLSLGATLANLSTYHRYYDFVTLLFPMVFCFRCGTSFALRCLTAVNVLWFFFGTRLAFALCPPLNSPVPAIILQSLFLSVLLGAVSYKSHVTSFEL